MLLCGISLLVVHILKKKNANKKGTEQKHFFSVEQSLDFFTHGVHHGMLRFITVDHLNSRIVHVPVRSHDAVNTHSNQYQLREGLSALLLPKLFVASQKLLLDSVGGVPQGMPANPFGLGHLD